MEVRMRTRVARVAAILAGVATLGLTTSASGSILAGTYAGKITGVEGHASFKGGNMKFKICGCGRIRAFQFSKIRVGCTDGRIYRTSGHVTPEVRAFRHHGVRKFKFHASNSYGAVLKVVGVFRGNDHARGLLRFKGKMQTTGGVKTCTTFRQLWSAGHVR
jgi:hypothetical protein